MMEIPASIRSRYAFRIDRHCDMQVNNMCEALNMAILEYMDKLIITLVECLKHYKMVMIVKQKNLMSRFRNTICPKIKQIIERLKWAARG